MRADLHGDNILFVFLCTDILFLLSVLTDPSGAGPWPLVPLNGVGNSDV